ncbi:MAG: hypothetical protein K8F25_13275 [Fimbriimonadaceae bacterium]|nr:hypothetical protein [Alphaproteobacteria bacterium]
MNQTNELLSEMRRIGDVHYPELRTGQFATVNAVNGLEVLCNGAVYWTTGGGDNPDQIARDYPTSQCERVALITHDDSETAIRKLQAASTDAPMDYSALNVVTASPAQPVTLEGIKPGTAVFIVSASLVTESDAALHRYARSKDCVVVLATGQATNCEPDESYHWQADDSFHDGFISGELIREQKAAAILE